MSGGPEVRQQLADEIGRHQGLRGPMDDERPDVWQNRCVCGWDDGDERTGWRERYRLHVADALMAHVDRIAAERAAEALRRHRIGPVRQAALVLSDAELNDALDLWYRQRETT